MQPLVSILIPAYNAHQYIADALASALAQTYPRTEIIVVDDGSTDGTLSIAERHGGDRVMVVTQRHQGASAARNAAFALSKGDYIQWLDADDVLAPDKIARQMELVDGGLGKQTLLCSPWGRFLYRQSHATFVPTSLWEDLPPIEFLLRKLESNLMMQTSTWLVSRELTEAAGPWDTRLLVDDDGEYFCRVLMQSDGVRFVPGANVFYRMCGVKSLSYIGRSQQKMESQFRSIRLHIAYLLSLDDSARARAAGVRYLQTWLISFYPERPDIVREAEQLAEELGGRLKTPRLSWKYSWIGLLFGTHLAKRAHVFVPTLRWSVERLWDRALLAFDV